MPVSDEIFLPLYRHYREYEKSSNKEKFLANNRKSLRILFDSVWEQSIETIFQTKPRNHMDAIRIINRHKDTISAKEEVEIIDALLEVLRSYDALSEKSYINTALKLQPLFIGGLKQLCFFLASHNTHKEKLISTKLQRVLSRI